jgi:hypothetical protein
MNAFAALRYRNRSFNDRWGSTGRRGGGFGLTGDHDVLEHTCVITVAFLLLGTRGWVPVARLMRLYIIDVRVCVCKCLEAT